MTISRKIAGVSAAMGLAAAAGALALASGGHGVSQASAQAAPVAGPKTVDDFMLADQNLLARQLYRMSDDKAVVLLTYASADKQLRADAPALMALKAAYAGKGVDMLAVDSRIGDKRDPVIVDAKAAGLEMPILFDYEQLVGEELGVTRAAEVIVIDPRSWAIAYRGPVDGAKAAVDALVSGQKVALTIRPALGQMIAFPARAKAATFAQISYAKTIAPIVQQKCATCHQPGGIGPMPLNTYEQIKGFSPMIREVIRTHRMPPYLADETVGAFQDDDRLTPEQMKTLVHWIDGGAPRGAGEDPLKKVAFKAPDWPLGKPDIVLDIPAVKIAASGVMDYQHPVVAMTMPEGRWMKATTFRISDRQVVHHILSGTVNTDHQGADFNESQWGASLGGYGPGRGSNIQPISTGVWVPASGGVGFQNHYTPYGKETTEQTQMGLYFYKKGEEPKYVLRTFGIFDFSIEIPANEEFHPETSYITFPKDAVLYGITPHAHKRGGSTNVSIIYPDGKTEKLLSLPRYDFNWQYEYFLKTPLKVPAGSRIVAKWTYDNSARNPYNADHNKTVYWGEQTSDEMMATYLHYRWVDETVAHQTPEYEKLLGANLMMGVLDDNMDGKIQLAELKGGPQGPAATLKKYFALIDANHDGALDPTELTNAAKLMPRRGPAAKAADAKPAAPAVAPADAKPAVVATAGTNGAR
jgi:mono/diheme cytochrome c family protein